MSISLPVIFQLVVRGIRHGPAALLNAKEYSTNPPHLQQTKKAVTEDGFVRLPNGKVKETEREVPLSNLRSASVPSKVWTAPNDWSEP